MISISAETFSRIDLGHRGEHLARQIIFDLTPWQESYGKGSASLLAQLPKQDTPYPCSVMCDGNRLIWQISSADTSVAGKGKCELFYYVGEQLVKSAVFQTFIAESLADAGNAPDPYISWVNDVFEAKNEAIVAKEAIESMSVSVQTLPAESVASVSKTVEEGSVHLSFGIPCGKPGEKGEPGNAGKNGADGYTPIRGVDYFTKTDIQSFENDIDAKIDSRLGDVENALDEILVLQKNLIGGDAI